MEFTVENVCGFLIRSRLVSAEDVRSLYQRWQSEAKEAASSLGQFSRWLVANKFVTEYQASLLCKGHADDFFLNQYQILDRLGRGRMAGVYKAMHHLGQLVAIKVLPPSKAKNPQLLGRFQREARMGIRLKHANVVRAFQIGEANGLNFLVMEYLEGETLDEVLQRRRKLPPTEAVRLVYQALLGLQHIHEQGIVHRDLKPANLMLVPGTPMPGTPMPGTANRADQDTTLKSTVKILDIGLGRALFDEGTADNVELTDEGVLLGTPDYLAPEQARNARSIDIRADIYGLGCVLYHCLTGQPPFPDTNLLSQMVRHATEQAKPLGGFNPAIPDGLQQIINWMLAKKPEERYPTPERAAQALQMFLVADSEPARPAEEPHMRRFLTWLETGDEGKEALEATLPLLATPVIPAAFALPAHTPPPASPLTAPPAMAPPAMAPPAMAPPLTAPPPPASSAARPAATAPKMSSGVALKKKDKRSRPARAEPVAAGKPVAAKTAPQPAVPPAASAAPATPATVPAAAADVDVELVSVDEAVAAGQGLRSYLPHSRRDWVLLGIGAGSVVLAGLLGMLLAILLQD